MATRKYDWPKIKQEFFLSDYNEVKQYFEDNFKIYNATITGKTKGWTVEKEQYKKSAIEKAQQEYEKERIQKWKKVLRNIDTARMAGLQELGQRLVDKNKINSLQVREITEALKHMRLELGETTEEINNRVKILKTEELDNASITDLRSVIENHINGK